MPRAVRQHTRAQQWLFTNRYRSISYRPMPAQYQPWFSPIFFFFKHAAPWPVLCFPVFDRGMSTKKSSSSVRACPSWSRQPSFSSNQALSCASWTSTFSREARNANFCAESLLLVQSFLNLCAGQMLWPLAYWIHIIFQALQELTKMWIPPRGD